MWGVPPLSLKHFKILCCVPTHIWSFDQIPSTGMYGVPPLFLKHLTILCGVPTLIWSFDQIPSTGMYGVPPLLLKRLRNILDHKLFHILKFFLSLPRRVLFSPEFYSKIIFSLYSFNTGLNHYASVTPLA